MKTTMLALALVASVAAGAFAKSEGGCVGPKGGKPKAAEAVR